MDAAAGARFLQQLELKQGDVMQAPAPHDRLVQLSGRLQRPHSAQLSKAVEHQDKDMKPAEGFDDELSVDREPRAERLDVQSETKDRLQRDLRVKREEVVELEQQLAGMAVRQRRLKDWMMNHLPIEN